MAKLTYLVLGGKGKTGRKVTKKLTDLGHEVRLASRSTSPSFDWENPASYEQVLKGIDAVYITFQPDLAIPQAQQAVRQLTERAAEQGVKHLVLLSGRGEPEAQSCEQIVINAGLQWTIVRADWFSQNFSENFFLDSILSGQVALPRADTPVAYVDTDDIADVVVQALLNESQQGKIHELTGSKLWTFKEVISEISKATDRDIVFIPITLDQYADMLREYQVPEDFIWLVEYLFGQVLDGRNASITDDIEKVLGRKPKDFSTYVKQAALTGVWTPESVPA
ncbi:MAG: NAD(P)H-binding protein [Reichenbachiella sp.]